MDITIEYLTGQGIDKEVAQNILLQITQEIEGEKEHISTLENELKEKSDSLSALTTEIESLKSAGATAEEYKAKFEQLSEDVAKSEQERSQQRDIETKRQNELERFSRAAIGTDGKPLIFGNDLLKDGAFALFQKALSDTANAGKADNDIYSIVTKDIPNLYTNITGTPPPPQQTTSPLDSDLILRAAMGLK